MISITSSQKTCKKEQQYEEIERVKAIVQPLKNVCAGLLRACTAVNVVQKIGEEGKMKTFQR